MASGDITGKGASLNPHSAPRLHQQKILQVCQQHAEQYASGLLKQAIDKLDDVLFERSNKGGADANDFLEAARELRVKRQDLSRSFLDKFAHTYKSRLKLAALVAVPAKKEGALSGGLSLVDEQDLEESLAVDGLVAKASDRFRNELFALAQRFNHLIDGAQYSEEMQPLAPDTVAHAFRDSFHDITWKVEIKLISYKLFEQLALQSLGGFYQQLNALMSNAGILPELKLGVAIRASGGAAQARPAKANDNEAQIAPPAHNVLEDGLSFGIQGGGQTGVPGGVQAGGQAAAQGGSSAVDIYQTLQQLMNARKYGPASGDEAMGAMSGGGGGMVMGPSLPADDLVRGLSLLQHTPLPTDPGSAITVAVIKDALLEQMHQIGDGRGIHPAHDNTIDVIGMIFEFILDEPSIPDVVKNLLNRLQIPILKVAIVDKAFFTNKTHPARRLLNVLGHASIGWGDNSEEARQRRFEKMEYVVSRVLAEFEQDPGIFAALLDEFTEFLANEGEEVVAEQATPLDVNIQEESPDRLAFEIVESRLEGADVPAVLRNFLRDIWRNVLQHALDHEGHDSDIWRRREQTVDDLMWSVEPKTTAEERRRMVMSLPRLLDALREGMAVVDCTQQEMDAVIDALEPIHMACLRGEKPREEQPAQTAETAEASSNAVTDMIRSIQAGMSRGDDSLLVEDGEALANDALENDLLETGSELGGDEHIEDEFTAMAADMKLGTWLEFALEDKKRRGKLAWKSAVMGEYVFVDRKYKVVAERNLAGLAADLRHGRASLVEDVAMFDRALDKVLNGLMTSGKAAH